MNNEIFVLTTSDDILATLARLLKKIRLEKGYSRVSLQSATGVPAPTIARFECSHKISLESFVKLSMALGYQDELTSLLTEDKYVTMEEMETIKKTRTGTGGRADAEITELIESAVPWNQCRYPVDDPG